MQGPTRRTGRPRPAPRAARAAAPKPKPPRTKPRRNPNGMGDHRVRVVVGRAFLVVALVAAGLRLVQVQGFEAEALSQKSLKQRVTVQNIPGQRGSIMDRDGNLLAFSVEAKALYALPQLIVEEQRKAGKDPDERKRNIAAYMKQVLGDQVDEQELLRKLFSDSKWLYLVDRVEPAKARMIREKFREIGAEYRQIRQYPSGKVGADIVGFANWRMEERKAAGLEGLETYKNNLLSGKDGRRVVDTAAGSADVTIPGSEREVEPATPGSDLQLTIDTDLQFTVQNMLTSYVQRVEAKGGSAVVLDAKTGEVMALADDKPFDPNNFADSKPEQRNNRAVTSPFEPGSVNKVVTAATAIELGLATPQTVLSVPGSIKVADREISDAWNHGTIPMTFTGVIGKSSNVGTLMMAQQIGQDRFAEMLGKFGLGERTRLGLAGETSGRVPPRSQWSGSTFGNLPIGQGLSMTVVQMAGMYQALANDGLRIPPRIIKAEIGPDKVRKEEPRPEGVRVVSPETARTVRDMMRAVVQDVPGQRGTGPAASLPGYQITGKTGTAQQVDPNCGCYSNSSYWITFAGILPADKPRYVIGIMLDAPKAGTSEATSAAPLFHDMADYVAQRYRVPLSPAAPTLELLPKNG
ncbi:peptidoglycan D,D-transpeptidase FtsI family protein [Allokutzneria albata]|uniref:Cell division protein FtsI (Penicillin-binding protein 3) n=1 Tax=Allokutzneria albata TaxID=211114 RepID=A0A1G9X308_ALLAB|nr:penicillin-binding protein 2 [Allokutzneria albata]SDM91072.1 cell division protein FtsI (penicillin-binding protein 3) [Allokutzneria albata]